MSKFKWIAATTLTAGLVLGGTTVATTAAMAGVPNPTPTDQAPTDQAPQFGYDPSHSQPRAALWQFDFTGANIDGLVLNDVRGTSPILMSRWTETDLNPFVSRFSRGINSVTLRHNRLPLPVLNLDTCTATFDQVGHFRIIAGTGTGAGFRVVPGTDTFILRGLVSLDFIPSRHHRASVCPLQFDNPWNVRNEIENNLPVAGQQPTLVDFDVQGNAQLVRVRPFPVPFPTPTGPGHFIQTPNPDNNPVGQPTDSVSPA